MSVKLSRFFVKWQLLTASSHTAWPHLTPPQISLKKAVKNRVQYHGERCNRGQFIALWNTTF